MQIMHSYSSELTFTTVIEPIVVYVSIKNYEFIMSSVSTQCDLMKNINFLAICIHFVMPTSRPSMPVAPGVANKLFMCLFMIFLGFNNDGRLYQLVQYRISWIYTRTVNAT